MIKMASKQNTTFPLYIYRRYLGKLTAGGKFFQRESAAKDFSLVPVSCSRTGYGILPIT